MIYKPGDKVTISIASPDKRLSKGKEYEVLLCSKTGVRVVNDVGIKYHVPFYYIVPYTEKGRGNNNIIVAYGSSILAEISNTFRPVVGQYLLVNKTPLRIKSVIVNALGDSVVSVSNADKGTIERAKLL